MHSMSSPNPYRLLPSVAQVLTDVRLADDAPKVPSDLLADLIGQEIEALRAAIGVGRVQADDLQGNLEAGGLIDAVRLRIRQELGRGVQRAINATGVVMHTGLGRSPVHPEVAAAMARAAGGYCVLEVDRFSGERNERDERLSVLLGRLVGCEAAIAVNNNAAAAFLTMHTFAHGREAIVSRGELVEIGGSFRVPDVMSAAGVRLVEVGATNRTRVADYERAIRAETGLLMKVHGSNFKMVGFIEEVPMAELSELGRKHSIPTAFDLGSGRIEAPGAEPLSMLGGETLVRDALESGLEVVTFSGDKLLGGPQAGILAGSAERMRALRKNPLYRATRLDKVALAGLECTLQLLLAGRGDEIPTRRMLLADPADLRGVADQLAGGLDALEGIQADCAPGTSQPGSGSAPGEFLPTHVVRVKHASLSVDEMASALRASQPPLFTRIHEGSLVLDPRTLMDGEIEQVLELFAALA